MKNKGDLITEAGIRAEFSRGFDPQIDFFIYDETDSTNTRAKLYAEENSQRRAPAVFIADGQTAGRGRRGRSFASDKGKGVYMSILTYPEGDAGDAVAITVYTAAVLCRALEKVTGLSPKIKWVNDIYISGKKLSGILTEGSINTESGGLNYAVTGIGLNVLDRDFGELSDIATSVEKETGKKIPRHAIIAAITEEFLSGYSKIGSSEIAKEYRERSFIIGKEVAVILSLEEYSARVLDITDKCELLLEKENGEILALSTGEVSLKLK